MASIHELDDIDRRLADVRELPENLIEAMIVRLGIAQEITESINNTHNLVNSDSHRRSEDEFNTFLEDSTFSYMWNFDLEGARFLRDKNNVYGFDRC